MDQPVIGRKFSCEELPKRCFSSFDELRSEKQLCDYTLNVGGVFISAHRVILAGAIPYFRKMFSKGIGEIPNIEPTTLACLVDYAYTHEVIIDTTNVNSLLAAAGQLGIDEVKQACLDFLSEGFKPERVRIDQDLASGLKLMLLQPTDGDIGDNYNVTSETGGSLNYPVTNLKNSAENNTNVEKEEVLDDALCSKNSSVDRENVKPELPSESGMLPEEPPLLDIEDDLPPKTREVVCSNSINPLKKSKEEYASNEVVQNPCIYKLNATDVYRVQRFNLLQEEWITENPEAFVTFSGSAVPVDNKMYFFRFATTLQYDPRCNSFQSMSCMRTCRDFFGAAALGNKIYICGGRIGNSTVTNAVECFHTTTDTWEAVKSMSTRRLCPSTVTLDGCVFALGGKCESTVHRSVEKYDPMRDEWTLMAPMLKERWAAGAATLNGRIYVCGGMSLNLETLSSCEVYYFGDNEWVFISSITPLNCRRRYFALLTFQEKLYAIGGRTDEDDVHVFDIYDPETDMWTFGPSTDTNVLTSSAFVLPVVDAQHSM